VNPKKGWVRAKNGFQAVERWKKAGETCVRWVDNYGQFQGETGGTMA